MSKILEGAPLDGVSSAEAAWREYVERRDAHSREYLANCDEIARTYLAECGTPEVMARWCDSFLGQLAAGHDSFIMEYRSNDVLEVLAGLAELARQQVLREEYDEHFPQGAGWTGWRWYGSAREWASPEEIVEAVAHGIDVRSYSYLRNPEWGGASHEEALDAAASGVRLNGYVNARKGANLRPTDPQRDTRASHQEVLEIHAMGLKKADDLDAYMKARARSSHAEVKEALAKGAVTAAFLRAYAKARRAGTTHDEIMDRLTKGGVTALLGPSRA